MERGSLQDQRARRKVRGSPPKDLRATTAIAACPSNLPMEKKLWEETRPAAVRQGAPKRSEDETQ